jgi:hypothetical protein
VDATLENPVDGAAVDYVESWQSYEDVDIQRGVSFVRDRYFVISDRLEGGTGEDRTYQWRMNGYAGLDSGGEFSVDGDTARWARDAAGVDLSLSSTGEGLALVEPEYEEGDRPHVHEVDDGVAHHKVIDGEVRGEAPGFLAVLAPYQVGAKGADGPLEVTALETSDGQAAWAITTADGTDIAWLREPDATGGLVLPDGRTATTDAEFLLFDLDGTFTLLSRGSYASLDGSVFAASSAESGVALVE